MRAAVGFGSGRSSRLTAAAAPFRRASQRTTGTGTVSPEMGKFSIASAVSPPHSGRRPAMAALFLTAEGDQPAGAPHGAVVDHQKARALQHPRCPVRQEPARPFVGTRVARM